MTGILLVDKPPGLSSFDVIRQLRKVTGIKKIGHAGTLDPLATGLLVILFGTACKQASRFLKLDKAYEAELLLGATSSTDDAEGEKKVVSKRRPGLAEIKKAVELMQGEQLQTPPIHSAVKVNGQRAYRLARAGKKVSLQPRRVTIYELKIARYKYPKLALEARVSSGTYIRSLARQLGDNLGTGAFLNSLKRTAVGNYQLTNCIQLKPLKLETIKKNIIAVQSS